MERARGDPGPEGRGPEAGVAGSAGRGPRLATSFPLLRPPGAQPPSPCKAPAGGRLPAPGVPRSSGGSLGGPWLQVQWGSRTCDTSAQGEGEAAAQRRCHTWQADRSQGPLLPSVGSWWEERQRWGVPDGARCGGSLTAQRVRGRERSLGWIPGGSSPSQANLTERICRGRCPTRRVAGWVGCWCFLGSVSGVRGFILR